MLINKPITMPLPVTMLLSNGRPLDDHFTLPVGTMVQTLSTGMASGFKVYVMQVLCPGYVDPWFVRSLDSPVFNTQP